MKRTLLYTLITLLALLELQAQKVTIRGTVSDDKGSPIEVASVSAEGQAAGTFTDLKGRYAFTCDSRDSLVIVYSMLGYQTRDRKSVV